MQTELKIHSNKDGHGVIELTVPPEATMKIAEVIRGILTFAGHNVLRIDDDGEEWISTEEMFPEGSPAMALRGFRGKMELTQSELADKLGVSQNAISELESGKRPISIKMAKKLEKEFNVPYKVFL